MVFVFILGMVAGLAAPIFVRWAKAGGVTLAGAAALLVGAALTGVLNPDPREGLAAIEPDLVPYLFGHLADGNLHIVLNRAGPLLPEKAAMIEAVLYRDLASLGGSFSAEHGVGSKRIHSLVATADATKIRAMHLIKGAFDPAHLLNAGKVLPKTSGR